MGLVAACAAAALLLACAPALAAPPLGVPVEQEAARRGVLNGQLKPLNSVIAEISRKYNGRVIDVETERGRKGELRYEIKLIDAQGRKHEVLVDAATGAVVAQESDWPTQPVPPAQMARYIKRLEQRYGARVSEVEFERDAQGQAVYEVKLSEKPAGQMKLLMDVSTGEVIHPPQGAAPKAAIKPMWALLESLPPRFAGLVLEVELETDHRRQPHYSVELLQPDGHKLELEVDAVTLQVLRQKVDE